MFLPTILLSQFREDPHHLPDLGVLVGVPEDSPLVIVLFLSANSLLWMAGACGLWRAGRWVGRKVARACS
jgi:hypothetical protein